MSLDLMLHFATSAQLRGVLLAVLLISTGCNSSRVTSAQTVLADDRLCELWVSHQIHQLTDMWRNRYGIIVSCQSTNSPARGQGSNSENAGQITVTVTLANGEEPPSGSVTADTQETLRRTLEAIVARQGWSSRYPKTVLQFLP